MRRNTNRWELNLEENTAKCITKKNDFVIIDLEDYEKVSQYTWHKNSKGYFQTGRIPLTLHHLLIGKPAREMETDHINRNIKDNRKTNLRFVTHHQNVFNACGNSSATSKYKGVCWDKRYKKWHVRIMFCGKQYHLGYFDSEVEAAKAYDKKAAELFGAYAFLNSV